MRSIIMVLSLLGLLIFGAFTFHCKTNQEEEKAGVKEITATMEDGAILFYRSTRQGKGDLYIMNEKGKNVRRIGQSGSRPDHYPNWSPDGQYIAFESYRKGGWRIWIMKADGSEAKRVLNSRSGISTYEFDPSFSSNGERIFFASNGDLFSAKRNGTDLQQITHTPNKFEYSPYQSPDGKKLVYVSRGQIHMMNMDGTNRLNLTNNEHVVDYAPIWSPDGKQILYYSDISGSFELHLMNADGSNKRFLLDKEEMKKQGFTKTAFIDAWDNDWGAYEQFKASFSSDGQKIAFSRDVDGNREIFTVHIDGTGITRLTNNRAHDGFPIWKP